MKGSVEYTVGYFRAPAKYFWQWGDGGEVTEWADGTTICYRDDIVWLLRNFFCYKPPSFSAILLLVGACKDNFSYSSGIGILAGIIQSVETYNRVEVPEEERREMKELAEKAFQFLHTVSCLPGDLRKGPARITLMQEVFSAGVYNMSFTVAPLKHIADELDSGRIDSFVFKRVFPATTLDVKTDLLLLSQANDKFANAEQLKLRLKTGLSKIPEPVVEEIIEETSTDLFATLLKDPETSSVAKIAMQLVHVLNIPMHVNGSSQMPLGGISDITNRGSYDRLLLSELAQEDDLLMARLVNNEALFFRREQPPENPKLLRSILIDTTLKMWGIPRVFAIAAALAISRNSKHHEQVEAYTLSGDGYELAELADKPGVVEALTKLHHSLHSGIGLSNCMDAIGEEENNECFFITGDDALHNASFNTYFSTVRQSLSYVLTVSREGELKFFSYKNGNSKLLNTAKLDIETLLGDEDRKMTARAGNTYLPQFYQQHRAPLLYPLARVNNNQPKRFASLQKPQLMVGISEVRRVLLWGMQQAATELLDYIENGEYFFGYHSPNVLYIFVKFREPGGVLYKVIIPTRNVTRIDKMPEMLVWDVIFLKESFLICAGNFVQMDYNGNKLQTMGQVEGRFFMERRETLNISWKNEATLRKDVSAINNLFQTEHILFNVSDVQALSNGLKLGKHALIFEEHVSIKKYAFSQSEKPIPAEQAEMGMLPSKNPLLRYNRWVWNDGSEAMFDSRGLLHLKSSDVSLPEITIVMVIGKSTACWASDGSVTGNAYFRKAGTEKVLGAFEFYKTYFKPFIQRLS